MRLAEYQSVIDYTLGVTSPPLTGARVLRAQRILKGDNVRDQDFLAGMVDGVFGEETGRGCKRAKYWLGYPTDEITATYGPNLDAFLTGEESATDEMRTRRKIRLEEAAKKPLRERALAEARKHIGTRESPAGSNRVLFSKWYGVIGPWCAMFVTYCYEANGAEAFIRGRRYAYVPYVVADARAGRNWLSVTTSPQPGDLVCYDWDGGVADHIGLFESGTRSQFTAIEGNTAVGNDSNGGQVMRRERRGSQVECFVRVGR